MQNGISEEIEIMKTNSEIVTSKLYDVLKGQGFDVSADQCNLSLLNIKTADGKHYYVHVFEEP